MTNSFGFRKGLSGYVVEFTDKKLSTEGGQLFYKKSRLIFWAAS